MPQAPLRGEDMGRVLRTFRCWSGPISSAVLILVLGYGPTRRARYVVPWSTIDPNGVRMLRRSQLISRYRGMPQVSPHYRIGTGPLAYRSLAVNGLDTATDAGTWLHIPGLLAMVADGHTAARGMAARVSKQEIVVSWAPGPSPLRPRKK